MNEEKEYLYFADKILNGVSERWGKKWNYEPLEVRIYLATPLVLNHPWLHLDGVLSHLALRKALGEDYYLLPAKYPISKITKGLELPNFPIRYAGAIPQASISFFGNVKPRTEVVYKKLEDRWLGIVKKLYHGSGYFKDYAMKHIYIPTPLVKFYVVGDKEGLLEILSELVSLGDNSRLGWGYISSIEITSISEDKSIVHEGKAMRPIPVRFCRSWADSFLLAWRPPYWSTDMVEECVPPGSEVELLPETIEKMRL
jgi:hypothetical protein